MRPIRTFRHAPPPVLTNPYFANVSLQLHGNGTDGSTAIIDSSSYGHTVTVHGNAQIDTGVSKYGGSSIILPASGDYLSIASHAAFGFGTGDFTLEGWHYRNASSGDRCLLDTRTGSNVGCAVYVSHSADANALCYLDNTGAIALFGSGGFTLNAFEHWAIVRQGTTIYGYLSGVQVLTGTDSRTFASASTCFIGDNYVAPSQPAVCSADDIRITKGVCLYPNGTTFTPPTEFPDS